MKPELKECAGGCGRMLRPVRTKIADYENTVAENKGGKCATCIRRESEGEPPGPKVMRRPSHCVDCKRPLHSHRGPRKPTDPPESRRYAGRGRCPTCYARVRREEAPKKARPTPPPPPPAARVPASETAAALARFQAARKARMVRAARAFIR